MSQQQQQKKNKQKKTEFINKYLHQNNLLLKKTI